MIFRPKFSNTAATPPAGKRSRYPRFGADYRDLEQCIEKFVLPGCLPPAPIIGPQTRVRVQGSCFATNMAAALAAAGVAVGSLTLEEIVNTPRHNADLLATVLASGAGQDFDELRQDEVFILTLGVAEGPLSDNATALAEAVSTLRTINPDIKVVLTVSPVPLNSSTDPSAVVADCVSKSKLRVIADEYVGLGIKDVYYWPSFEIVRWIGAHTGPAYGVDDDLHRHVNLSTINMIVRLFLKHYSTLSTPH